MDLEPIPGRQGTGSIVRLVLTSAICLRARHLLSPKSRSETCIGDDVSTIGEILSVSAIFSQGDFGVFALCASAESNQSRRLQIRSKARNGA
jgi:hypothetical protein